MTTHARTATVITEAGNINVVDLDTFVAGTILPWNSAEGEQPNCEAIAAKLAGRHFDTFAELDAAIVDIVENDADVFETPVDHHELWLDVLEMQRIERNVVGLCSGLEWESFRDGFEPMLWDGDEATVFVNCANECIDAWLARKAS